ncbi:hypothetical protein KIH27_18145 [Mycobacterium sp. M1]|uniref:Glycosyl transferase n=1 Tax=Mycolicibacter acidiphilus TaxID=2835306 RepID=A0ABS5RMH7_9MYCO|nr:hypothetical protein [Mycolicibacter acidiphilus]MBS9535510.1 hypothetical protein [Mycolicibacter acidiphilus]
MDAGTVFTWAQSYFDFNDFANARKWYTRFLELGGSGDERFCSMYRLAVSMHKLGEAWPDVQDAYLRAWAVQPTRAEPLHAVASHYRRESRYRLGYLFAQRAADIPPPDPAALCIDDEVYIWRARDERAVCAAWTGRPAEAFTLNRQLLTLPDLPATARQRIAKNRDFSVPAMQEAATAYPAGLIESIVPGLADTEVTVSLIAGPNRSVTELTLNSILNCCRDLNRIGRFLAVDTGLSPGDRHILQDRYPFIEVVDADTTQPPAAQLRTLRAEVRGRFWLHLGQGWQFFAPDDLITRLTSVLEAEPHIFQVGVNFADADELTGVCAAEDVVRRAPGAGRYVPTSAVSLGPAMFHTSRMDQASNMVAPASTLAHELGRAGFKTATLDEVLCIAQC